MHVGDIFPPSFTVPLSLKSTLRYGENPHQKAAFYGDKSLSVYNAGGIATAVQHHGKVRRSFFSVLASTKGYTNYSNIHKEHSLLSWCH
jgi:AICAR transformylase/IMP cyclohydrolase PurH